MCVLQSSSEQKQEEYQPKIDKKKLKKLFNTDFASIASNVGGGGGGFNPLDLLGGGLGGGGVEAGGRPGRKPPSRRAQQRYRRRFGNRALLIEDLVDYHSLVEVEVFVFLEQVEYSVLQWQDLSMGEDYLKDKHKHRQ